MMSEWDCRSGEIMVFLENFNEHIGKFSKGFEGVQEGNVIGKRNEEGRILLEFCDKKELCLANTWFF